MKIHMNILFVCCFASFAVLIFSACNNDQTTANRLNPFGVYTLITIDAKHVPTSVPEGGVIIQVISGTFAINTDSTCTSKMTIIPPGGTEITTEASATYTMNDLTLTMHWKGAGITVGTISGNTFTMENEGLIYVYSK